MVPDRRRAGDQQAVERAELAGVGVQDQLLEVASRRPWHSPVSACLKLVGTLDPRLACEWSWRPSARPRPKPPRAFTPRRNRKRCSPSAARSVCSTGRKERPRQPARQLAFGESGDGGGPQVCGLGLQVRLRRGHAQRQPGGRDLSRHHALAMAGHEMRVFTWPEYEPMSRVAAMSPQVPNPWASSPTP